MAGDALAAGRYGDGARELLPYDRAREDGHAAAAVFLRDVELPDAESLARFSKRSRYSGLTASPSVVWRSIGISSLSTKRRSPALRIRSSSGSSKSIPQAPWESSRHNTRTSTATVP
jgi:hypothetical protein